MSGRLIRHGKARRARTAAAIGAPCARRASSLTTRLIPRSVANYDGILCPRQRIRARTSMPARCEDCPIALHECARTAGDASGVVDDFVFSADNFCRCSAGRRRRTTSISLRDCTPRWLLVRRAMAHRGHTTPLRLTPDAKRRTASASGYAFGGESIPHAEHFPAASWLRHRLRRAFFLLRARRHHFPAFRRAGDMFRHLTALSFRPELPCAHFSSTFDFPSTAATPSGRLALGFISP